jgi:hypothetical protein
MCTLEWLHLCQPSSDVWACIQCWSVWQHCRHACHYLQVGRFYCAAEMGGQFLCNLATQPVLDRAGFHGFDKLFWCTMEHQKDETVVSGTAVYWF